MGTVFSKKLIELMKAEDLNQSRLAEKTGIKQNTISAWLRGVKEPSIASLCILADYFDVTIDFLVGRKEY